MKNYYMTQIPELFTVSKIVTAFYDELPAQLVSESEHHDFWEVLYMDRGRGCIHLDDVEHYVRSGEVLFYPPNAVHSIDTLDNHPVGIGIISFVCHSPAMQYFSKTSKIKLDPFENQLFSSMITESTNSMERLSVENPLIGMCERPNITPGSLQTIKVQLELLLLRLFCREAQPDEISLARQTKKSLDNEIVLAIKEYLKDHISQPMTIDRISHDFNLSPSLIKLLFKNHVGCGVIEYYINMKIERAKLLIRKNQLNFTEIADLLGFSNVHYFSKLFKQRTGLTPSEYSRSIKP